MTLMNRETIRVRALSRARGRGELIVIGQETRTQQELVEEGHLWQQIADGHRYRFTLSPSGQRILDRAEAPQLPQDTTVNSSSPDASAPAQRPRE